MMASPEIPPQPPNDPELFTALLTYAQNLVEQEGSPFWLSFSKAVAAGEMTPLDVDKDLECFDAYPYQPEEIYGNAIYSYDIRYYSEDGAYSDYMEVCNVVEVGKVASGDNILLHDIEGYDVRAPRVWLFNPKYRDKFGLYGEMAIDYVDSTHPHGTGDPFIYWIGVDGLIRMRHFFDESRNPRRHIKDFELEILLDALSGKKPSQ